MARKLRKGKVSPLDPDKQSKKKEAAERKVASKKAKDTAPPKRKKAKAKTKAKPKAKAKVGTPKIASALGIASRAGPAVLASIAAAAGGVKLLGAGFSYATRGGKVRKADSKLLARQDRLSKAVGKQPGPVGEFSKVSGRKAPPKGAVDRVEMDAIPPEKKPRYTSATFDTTGEQNWIPSRTPVEKYVEEGAAKPAAKPAVKKAAKPAVKEVKATSKSQGSTAGIANMDEYITREYKKEAKPAAKEVKAVTADSPGPKKKQTPVKAKKAAKPKTTLKGITPPRKPKRGGATKEAKRATKKGLTPTESYLNISTSGSSPEKKGPTVTAKENPMGRSIDNVLRGIFSFAGALPQASDIEAPKSRQRKDQEKRFKQFLVK
jgi:hypothetical protein